MADELSGRCHCGATSYTATGDIVGGGICFCSNCQGIGGGGPNYALSLTNYTVSVKGEPKVYSHPGGTGEMIDKTFCANCGVHLLAQGGGNSHLLRVKAGTLDDPNLYQPMAQLWTSDARAWHTLNPELPAFGRNPPGMAGEK